MRVKAFREAIHSGTPFDLVMASYSDYGFCGMTRSLILLMS
ncbi:MAG: hypothetical protein U9P36_11305 [Thermodesulfobacteriota bacterium]|nr:hypothetical protein [Thermodesulfobacteriota bacterium]